MSECSAHDLTNNVSAGADEGIPVCDLVTSEKCMWPAWGKIRLCNKAIAVKSKMILDSGSRKKNYDLDKNVRF